jgi:hypothetical protein
MTVTDKTRPAEGAAGNGRRIRLNPIVADFLERAGWSAGQVFFATVLAGGAGRTVADLPWQYAGVLALSAAVASVLLTGVQYLTGTTNLSFWPDMLIRLVKTFLASLAASFAASRSWPSWPAWRRGCWPAPVTPASPRRRRVVRHVRPAAPRPCRPAPTSRPCGDSCGWRDPGRPAAALSFPTGLRSSGLRRWPHAAVALHCGGRDAAGAGDDFSDRRRSTTS